MEDDGKLIQFGNKYIHYPQLLRGNLSMRSSKKKQTNWTVIPISHPLKIVFLDMIGDAFDPGKYAELPERDQDIFDRACKFANIRDLAVVRTLKASDRDREELFRRYEVLKGEVLAGSDSRETLKMMRNLLIEMQSKGYIPIGKYNQLMREILACI